MVHKQLSHRIQIWKILMFHTIHVFFSIYARKKDLWASFLHLKWKKEANGKLMIYVADFCQYVAWGKIFHLIFFPFLPTKTFHQKNENNLISFLYIDVINLFDAFFLIVCATLSITILVWEYNMMLGVFLNCVMHKKCTLSFLNDKWLKSFISQLYTSKI